MDTALGNKRRYQQLSQQLRQVHTIIDRFSMANTYLIEGERMIIVDPLSELNVRLALRYLRDFLRRTPTDIDLIVLTHLHVDHTAAIELLRRSCSAPVAASRAVQQLAHEESQGKQVVAGITHFTKQVLGQKTLPVSHHHLDLSPPYDANQISMINLWLEDVAGLPYHADWRVIASSGHTPGSICLYNPFSYELLCGDTLITVEGGTPLLRGSAKRGQSGETLRMLRSLEIRYLYPGHGRPIVSKKPFEHVALG